MILVPEAIGHNFTPWSTYLPSIMHSRLFLQCVCLYTSLVSHIHTHVHTHPYIHTYSNLTAMVMMLPPAYNQKLYKFILIILMMWSKEIAGLICTVTLTNEKCESEEPSLIMENCLVFHIKFLGYVLDQINCLFGNCRH